MKFSDTSPSMRGLGVWSRMLCNAVPPPPATVDTGVPPDGAGPNACKTERYDMREKAECASCHEIIDGIGFGLENYGPAGEWRTTEPNNADCNIAGYGEIRVLASSPAPELSASYSSRRGNSKAA